MSETLEHNESEAFVPDYAPARSHNPLMGFPTALVLALLFFITLMLIGQGSRSYAPSADPYGQIHCSATVQPILDAHGRAKILVSISNAGDKPFKGTVMVTSVQKNNEVVEGASVSTGMLRAQTRIQKVLWLRVGQPAALIKCQVQAGTIY